MGIGPYSSVVVVSLLYTSIRGFRAIVTLADRMRRNYVNQAKLKLAAWLSGIALVSINEVTLRRAQSVLRWDRMRRINHLGL